MREKRLFVRVAIVTLGLGVSLVLWGAWIPAKAWLAQRLIERAWLETQVAAQPTKPWPWADTWPIARLTLEDESIEPLFVLAGASGQAMAFGPGHVSTSASPGEPDNIVLAGHRDTHFSFLEKIERGDIVLLDGYDSSTRYVVEATEVVHESRVDLLERTGHAELTFVTCYPFDAITPLGPLRFVVHARAIESEPGDGRA